MRIAVIGDIHGDIDCLKHAMHDLNTRYIDAVFSTGDLLDIEENAQEIINLCKTNKIISVQGNHDKVVADENKCGEDICGYLRNLPFSFGFNVFDYHIEIVHGSTQMINEYMFEDSSLTADYLKSGKTNSILICGHTHIPYIINKDSVFVMNPGSVARPKPPESKPSYIILDIKHESLSHEIIRL